MDSKENSHDDTQYDNKDNHTKRDCRSLETEKDKGPHLNEEYVSKKEERDCINHVTAIRIRLVPIVEEHGDPYTDIEESPYDGKKDTRRHAFDLFSNRTVPVTILWVIVEVHLNDTIE